MIPEYITERIEICKNCPICDNAKNLCNSNLYLNPETNEVSSVAKDGFKRGCGCFLTYKIKNIKSKCPVGKW